MIADELKQIADDTEASPWNYEVSFSCWNWQSCGACETTFILLH